jgi:hypothetical protein
LFSFRKVALLFASVSAAGFLTVGATGAASAAPVHIPGGPVHFNPGGPIPFNPGGPIHFNPGGPIRHLPPFRDFPPTFPITVTDQCGCGDTFVPPPVFTVPSCGCSTPAPQPVTISVTSSCGCSQSITFEDTVGGQLLTELTGPQLQVGDWFTFNGVTEFVTFVDGNCFSVENNSGILLSENRGFSSHEGTLFNFGSDQGVSLENFQCFSTGNFDQFQFDNVFQSRDFNIGRRIHRP